MESKKWCIVEFIEDSDGSKPVEIVPYSWINEEVNGCYWPAVNLLSLKSLVKKGALPDLDLCDKIKYKRILSTFDTYGQACKKLPQALETSNLESSSSDEDRPTTRTRKSYKSALSSDRSQRANRPLYLSPVDSQPLQSTAATPNIVIQDDPYDIVAPLTSLFDSVEELNNQEQLRTIDNQDNVSQFTTRSEALTNDGEAYQNSTEDLAVGNEYTLVSCKALDELNALIKGFTETCVKHLEKQAEELKDIKAHLQNLKSTSTGRAVSNYSSLPQLPIVDEIKLAECETWLNLECNKLLMIEYFSLVGGDTVEKNVRKLLRRIFDTRFCRRINFTGKGDKVALRNLKLLDVIKESVRDHKPKAQDDLIESTAINWFRNSKSLTSA